MYRLKREASKPIENPASKKRMISLGEMFKKQRAYTQRTIEQVSNETKISSSKLEALETNDFSCFESPVHASGFIKIYASYLGLDTKKALAVYRRDYRGTKTKKVTENLQKPGEKKSFNFFQFFLFLIPLIAILSFLGYLYIQYYNFQNPPLLEIVEPANNTMLEEDSVLVKGKTEKETSIDINDKNVPVDENFFFETSISLQPGSNIITVRATNTRNSSREKTEILVIEYEEIIPEDTEDEIQEEVVDVLTLSIQNSPTWIEIIEDDQLILSEVLPVGYEKVFQPERNISISTGIVPNTYVRKNEEILIFRQNTYTITCEIEKSKLNCD